MTYYSVSTRLKILGIKMKTDHVVALTDIIMESNYYIQV